MAKGKVDTVSKYIASQPKAMRSVPRQVRRAIRKALPRAEEAISYKMPAYKLGGSVVLYFAGWKRHFSLYPASARIARMLKRELAPYEIRRGTIRFPIEEAVPVKLIARIAKLRGKEIADRGIARQANEPRRKFTR